MSTQDRRGAFWRDIVIEGLPYYYGFVNPRHDAQDIFRPHDRGDSQGQCLPGNAG